MTEAITLRSAVVSGVLGEYRHSVEFSPGAPFRIVYGPNGVGKTKFLEIIHALTSLRPERLLDAPFEHAVLRYSDDSFLSATRESGGADDKQQAIWQVEVDLSRPGAELAFWSVSSAQTTELERFLRGTGWQRVGPALWQDQADGEVVETAELEHRFGLRDGTSRRGDGLPSEFAKFRDVVSSHLIETQRLKIEDYLDDRTRFGAPRKQRFRTTINEHAESMKQRLGSALAENSRVSQQLDRTFPSRVLSEAAGRAAEEEDIRRRYALQNAFRSRLADVALLGLEPELSLPPRELSESERSMLDLYLADAERKLEPFQDLVKRIELLEQIVNSRLLRKTLHVDARDGLSVRNERGLSVDLDSLSSGEQHEIILMFDLLFNVKSGALVLIDEPEISLHVSWQVNFVADVERVADVAGFQFIVATHSPQIINNWWAYATQLGPESFSL